MSFRAPWVKSVPHESVWVPSKLLWEMVLRNGDMVDDELRAPHISSGRVQKSHMPMLIHISWLSSYNNTGSLSHSPLLIHEAATLTGYADLFLWHLQHHPVMISYQTELAVASLAACILQTVFRWCCMSLPGFVLYTLEGFIVLLAAPSVCLVWFIFKGKAFSGRIQI